MIVCGVKLWLCVSLVTIILLFCRVFGLNAVVCDMALAINFGRSLVCVNFFLVLSEQL